MSFTEMRKSRREASFEVKSSIMQYLRCLVAIQVELLVGDPYFTGEDMDMDLGVSNI